MFLLIGLLCQAVSALHMGRARSYDDVPQEFWDPVTPRVAQIVVAEALAVVLLHRDASDATMHRAGTLFIDNRSDNLPAL